MAGTLSWALVNLFLRYQEHPFVSVWGFQRENTLVAPGLTICIPAKYNKEKLKTARQAYRLLSHGDFGRIPLFEDWDSEMEGYEQYFDIWKKELENVSVRQARREIGFSKKDIFWYSSLFYKRRQFELQYIMNDVFMGDKSCWIVSWLALDTRGDPETRNYDSSSENDDEVGDKNRRNASSDTSVDFPSSLVSQSDSPGNDSSEVTRNVDAMDGTNVGKGPRFINRALGDLISQLLLSTPSPSQNRFESSKSSTVASTSDTAQGTKTNEERESEQTKTGKSDPRSDGSSNEGPGLFSLSMRDSITFVMNIQQYNWFSSTYFAGVELYLHHVTGAFWTVNPLLLRPGTMSTVYYKTTKYKFLPLPYKSFGGIDSQGPQSETGNTDCADPKSTGFQHKMLTLPPALYSSDMCMLERSMNRSTQVCGCSIETFYNDLHGTQQCSILKFQECFNRVMDEEFYTERERLGQGQNRDRPCPQACRMTRYESTMSSANYPTMENKQVMANLTGLNVEDIDENLVMVTIKPQGPLTVTVEHVPELTMLNILGSVGG